MDLTTLTDAGAGSPRLCLPLPSSAPLVGAAGAEGGRCGGTLTPSPSPALREQGDHGLGIVDRRGHRIATATLPPATPLVEAARGRGKVRGIIPPSSPAAWKRKGGGGKVRAARTPSPAPAVRELGGHGLGIVDRRGHRIATATLTPRFHSLSGGGRGPGEGVGHNPPLPLPQRGRGRGVGGKVRATRRAPPHWPRNRRNPFPPRRGDACVAC